MRDFFTGANRAFVQWVSGRAYRLVPLVILGLLVFPPIAWGLLILDVLCRGVSRAWPAAGAACLGFAGLGAISGGGFVQPLGLAAIAVAAAVALGALLGRSRSLTLAFQATVVAPILVMFGAFVIVPSAGRVDEIVFNGLLAFLEAGGTDQTTLAELGAFDPSLLTSMILCMIEIMLLGALMLGVWWYSLIRDEIDFGADFRALKLGRVAGIGLMLLVTLGLVIEAEALRYAAGLAVAGFLFQGLAVLHARSHSGNWHWIVVFAIYVALLPPLTGFAIMGLSTVGLLDNFFRLRAPAERTN